MKTEYKMNLEEYLRYLLKEVCNTSDETAIVGSILVRLREAKEELCQCNYYPKKYRGQCRFCRLVGKFEEVGDKG